MRATKGNENVFVDCGFPPVEAENLRIRAKVMLALTGYVQERKMTQARAARVIGVSQPRISDLVRGKIGLFTIDTLVNMVTAAGLRVDVAITVGRQERRKSRLPDAPLRSLSDKICTRTNRAGCMSDARRYQKDFDLLMQELEAEAKRRQSLDRDAAWKIIEKSFNKYADAIGLKGQRREAAKKKLLDSADD